MQNVDLVFMYEKLVQVCTEPGQTAEKYENLRLNISQEMFVPEKQLTGNELREYGETSDEKSSGDEGDWDLFYNYESNKFTVEEVQTI